MDQKEDRRTPENGGMQVFYQNPIFYPYKCFSQMGSKSDKLTSPPPVVAQSLQRENGAADLGHGGRGLTPATRTEPTHNALWWQLSCDSLNTTDTMPQDTRILTKYAYYTT